MAAPLVGLVAVGVFAYLAFSHPQGLIGVFLATILFVPYWSSISIGPVVVFPALLGAAILALLLVRSDWRGYVPQLSDGLFATGAVLVAACGVLFDQEKFLFTNATVTLGCAYALGRFSGAGVRRWFGYLVIVLAVWGILEFALDWHPFTDWQLWYGGSGPALQERGGVIRSEATMGHAIAFGAVLCLGLPFVSNLRVAWFGVAALSVGILTSLSRGPILAMVFTLTALAFVRTGRRSRAMGLTFLLAGLAMGYVVLSTLYSGSSEEELRSSTEGRSTQLERLISSTHLFGPAEGLQFNSGGRYVLNGVEIVDSAPLRLAVDFGWVVALLLLAPVIIGGLPVLIRRGDAPTVALFGQLPILAVTSLITQWQGVLFFVAGMATTAAALRRAAVSDRRRAAAEPIGSTWHARPKTVGIVRPRSSGQVPGEGASG